MNSAALLHELVAEPLTQRFEPFPHRLKIMPEPDCRAPPWRDGQGLLPQFVGHAHLAPLRLGATAIATMACSTSAATRFFSNGFWWEISCSAASPPVS